MRQHLYGIKLIFHSFLLILQIVSFIIIMQKQQADLNKSQQSHSQQDNQKEQEKVEGGLSKQQRKKIMKKEKWEKEKLIKRQQKRERQKQKKKLKRQQIQQQKQQNPPNQIEQKEQQNPILMKRRKDDYLQKMKDGLKVVIDLQFYDLMTEKEQNSLIKQLGYCHSVNRKQQLAFNYILTSASPDRQKIFAQRYNADKWGISMAQQSLIELYPRQKIVYLTGDAEEEIQEFNPDLIYVIGGIVDHNRLKKITYNYAIQNKIAVKRLPMNNIQLKASVHLAVNHVWEWMLNHHNGLSWDESLKSVIPTRKLQHYKEDQ